MFVLLIGLVLFLGAHLANSFFAKKRKELIETKGGNAWRIRITIPSLIGLGLIVYGYGLAREAPIFLYDPPIWASHLTALLMIPVFVLLVASGRPGKIVKLVKHPQLLAVKIWSFAHLLANGDLASVVLFGSFLAWGVFARISVKKRVANGLAENASDGPIINDVIAVVIAIGLYALFVLWAHEFLFGVAPIA